MVHDGAADNYQVGRLLFLLRKRACGERAGDHQCAQEYQVAFSSETLRQFAIERISEAGGVKRLGKKIAHLNEFDFAFELERMTECRRKIPEITGGRRRKVK